MTGSWERERRLDFIDWRLVQVGYVNRRDLMETFGVSQVQASIDLRSYGEAHPLTYNRTAKRYEGPGGARGMADGRVACAMWLLCEAGAALGWPVEPENVGRVSGGGWSRDSRKRCAKVQETA